MIIRLSILRNARGHEIKQPKGHAVDLAMDADGRAWGFETPDRKLAAIAHASSIPEAPPDNRLYGYSLQGVLFEMSDPEYDNPEGVVTVEIDARDGRQWVCHIDKTIVPANLQDLFRKEVLVTGDATFRPRKPLLEARTFKSLPGVGNPVRAMEELVALCGEKAKREPVQAFMDRVRERD